jgi:hypothetical protein
MFIGLSCFAATKNVSTSRTIMPNYHNLKIKKLPMFKPVMIYETMNCPTGSVGSITFWVVVDDASGQIVGGGSYGLCVEEQTV